MLRYYNVCACILCFCSFLWTLYGRVFHGAGAARRGPALIRRLGPPFIVLQALLLLRVRPGYGRALIGAMLYTTSLLLFWWCAWNTRARRLNLVFSGDVPDSIRVDGPYRFIRHPFYCSYGLAWFSGAIASGNRGLFLSALLVSGIYFLAARMEEDGFATSAVAAQYATYRARTGMFFPRVPGVPGAPGVLNVLRVPSVLRVPGTTPRPDGAPEP